MSKLQSILKSVDECLEKIYILNHTNKSCMTYEVKVASSADHETNYFGNIKFSENNLSKELFRATLTLQTRFQVFVSLEDKEYETKTIEAIKQHLLKRKYCMAGVPTKILTSKTQNKLQLGDAETYDFQLLKTPWDTNQVVPIQVLPKKLSTKGDGTEAPQKTTINFELCLFLESIQSRDSPFQTVLQVRRCPHHRN